jgi:hypothetical protein
VDVPAGAPEDTWAVAAIGPEWRPPPGEAELAPVPGRLELHPDGLVFRAEDVMDATTGAVLVSVVPAGDIHAAGPLSPGTRATPTTLAGSWMPAWQRRLRPPGFLVSTSHGPWLFDAPHGRRRAGIIAERYAGP